MATIKDVATLAGVSTATVSYVINKTRYVSEELTERVLEAIEELSFTPSKVAQSLRRGKTSIIGLIMDDITNRFASQFTRGLESISAENDYSIIISDLREQPDNEQRSINTLLDQKVDGIIYAGYGHSEQHLIELFNEGLPIVVVDKPIGSNRLPSVLIDNRISICKALEYLKAQGHHDILYINGLEINRNSVLRAESFKECLLSMDLPFQENNIVYGEFALEHGYETTLRFLEEKRKFTALMCGDDLVAFGSMAALKSRGIRIPEDVAVVGFDDDPMAAVFDPSLTTIRYPMYDMGQRSFEVFYKLASRKRKTPEHVWLETELIIRRSTESTYRDYHTLFRD